MTSQQITLSVPDMTCAHCVKTITQAIETAIEGTHVEADLTRHLVSVTGTDDAERIAAIIMSEDYHAEPL